MSDRRITQIPFPGNSGVTPTGAMQFQDDWPGLFIRGDVAIYLLSEIERLDKLLREKCKAELHSILHGIAEIIERDVIYRGEQS